MYVSGPPGTGKTALTTAVGRELATQGWRVVEVSVMGLKAQDVWTRLGTELGCGASEGDVIAHLKAKNTRTFIILDEIDSLLPPPPALPSPATSHVLSKLFSLPLLSSRGSTIKLVAISNTLDLTVRANLVLDGSAMPQVLPFKAYVATDMVAIVNARTAALGDGPEAVKVDAKAVELLCRKVEAQNGDLRMCLSVLSSAVGLAEADWVKKGSSPTALIKVALPHILKAFSSHTKVLRAAAGTTSTGASTPTTSKIRSVPLNGRMVLVSLLVWFLRTRAGLAGCPAQGASPELLTPSALYATYAHLLNHPSSPIKPSPESDYRDLLSNLETLGLVSLPKVRGGNIRVELCVREDEVRDGLALSAAAKAVGEEEVAQVWAREEARVARVCARAAAAVERAAQGLPMDMD
jgi:Cdc6-like AAA superfamily ATPase